MDIMPSWAMSFGRLLSDTTRLLKLATPLGHGQLLVQRVIAREQLSTPFTFTVDCLSQCHDINNQ